MIESTMALEISSKTCTMNSPHTIMQIITIIYGLSPREGAEALTTIVYPDHNLYNYREESFDTPERRVVGTAAAIPPLHPTTKTWAGQWFDHARTHVLQGFVVSEGRLYFIRTAFCSRNPLFSRDQNAWNQLQPAAEQANSVPQPVSNSAQPTVASAPPGPAPNSSAAPPTPAANTQQQGSQGMTVSQWLNSIHYGAGGPPANPPPKYLTDSIPLPNGGSWSFTAPYATFDETWDAIMNLPVSALENYSRPPITGRVSTNNDLPVTLEVAGPNGSQVVQGKLDSGAEETMIPESVMSQLGFVPTGSERVIGVTGNAVEPVYQVPVILVRGNNGQWEVLAQNVQVWGSQFDEVLVGANVLKQESLSVNGGSFALAFP